MLTARVTWCVSSVSMPFIFGLSLNHRHCNVKLSRGVLWIPKQILSIVHWFQTLPPFSCSEFARCDTYMSATGRLQFGDSSSGCPDILCPITKVQWCSFHLKKNKKNICDWICAPFTPVFWHLSELHSNSCDRALQVTSLWHTLRNSKRSTVKKINKGCPLPLDLFV